MAFTTSPRNGSPHWAAARPQRRMDTEIGYTAPTFAGLLTPYSGFRFSQDGTRGYRFGGRMEIGGLGNVSLEGLRDEASDAGDSRRDVARAFELVSCARRCACVG